MDKKRPDREITMLVTAISLITIGCGLLITSLVMPPSGEIDNSVLVAFGEILTFSGTLFGVSLVKAQ